MSEGPPATIAEAAVHVVEDDEAVRDAIALMLETRGLRVLQHASAEQFLEASPEAEPGCIVTDVQMPGMSGVELLRRLRAADTPWPAVVISGRASRRLAGEAAELGAAVMEKPFQPDELVAVVRNLIGARAA